MLSTKRLELMYFRNRLLSELPDSAWDRLAEDLHTVDLPLGETLMESGDPVRQLYFPTTATIASQVALASGAVVETASVGCEGVVGARALLGECNALNREVVVLAGHAYRIDLEALTAHCVRSSELRELLLRYANVMIGQFAQESLCGRHHSIEQRLCRWLLLSQDRCAGVSLSTTQERISISLGVRREGVTAAAGVLRARGLIENRRGSISILDRAGIEERSCECYARMKQEMDRLLPRRGRMARQPSVGTEHGHDDSHTVALIRPSLAPAIGNIGDNRPSTVPSFGVHRSL